MHSVRIAGRLYIVSSDSGLGYNLFRMAAVCLWRFGAAAGSGSAAQAPAGGFRYIDAFYVLYHIYHIWRNHEYLRHGDNSIDSGRSAGEP